MSLQIILKAPADALKVPVNLSTIETFPLPDNMVGLVIPTKIVDSVGESQITAALKQVEHFDLWTGQWNIPE